MDQKQQHTPTPKPQSARPGPVPNEVAGFSVDGVVKIFDPTTKEVFVEKRS